MYLCWVSRYICTPINKYFCPDKYIWQPIWCLYRYIGLLANFTFDTGVRENVQKEKTSQLAASMFKQVSLAPANSYHYLCMQIAHEKCQMMIYEFQWSRAAKFACWIFKYLFFQCSMADHLNIPVLQWFQWFSAEEERGGESLQVVRGRLWNVRLLTGRLHQYCTARLISLTI